jgi:hypothetical protein
MAVNLGFLDPIMEVQLFNFVLQEAVSSSNGMLSHQFSVLHEISVSMGKFFPGIPWEICMLSRIPRKMSQEIGKT